MASSNDLRIPKNKEEIFKELKTLYQQNRSRLLHFSGRHKLLCSILATERLRRSSTRGFLFVMGCTGTGKSSTINHIFNFQQKVKTLFSETSSSKSQTRIVQEYLFCTNSSQYESSDISLGIVDTPGYGDTKGSRQDACNLVAIKDFLSTHPNLQGKCPNLVLVCFDATDCRYEGPSSGFNKLLKCIKKLEIVDVNKPNLVVIITKSCSLTPHHSQLPDSWNENIRQLQMNIKQTVLTTLRIDAPIVILENNYEMQSLKRPKMPNGKESDFTLLPNGEKQPLNLFQACSKVLKNNKDYFGQICINEIFVHGKDLTPEKGFDVPSDTPSSLFFPLSDKSRLLTFIEEISEGVYQENIFELEAPKFIKKQKLTGESKNDFDCLISDINECAVLEYFDFKLISINILEYYLKRDLKNVEREFLKIHLKMKEIPADPNLSETIQSGYHIFSDSFTTKQIFNVSPQLMHGIFIPKSFSLENICEREYFAEYSKDKAELIAKRIQLLNGVKMKVKEDDFEFNHRPGFQIVSDESDQSAFDFEFYEKRYFEVISTSEESKLSSDFINAVKKLPNIYKSENSSLFKEFFEEFGHYFILSVYVGGSYERTGKTSVCYGGDPTFANVTLNQEKRKIWETSVLNYPRILKSEMKLEPISTAVGQVDVERKEAVGLALSDLFHHCELGANEACGFVPSLSVDDEESCWTREEAVDLEMSTGLKVLCGFLMAIGLLLSIPLMPVTFPAAIGFLIYAHFGNPN